MRDGKKRIIQVDVLESEEEEKKEYSHPYQFYKH
jgi:hypothetical protein